MLRTQTKYAVSDNGEICPVMQSTALKNFLGIVGTLQKDEFISKDDSRRKQFITKSCQHLKSFKFDDVKRALLRTSTRYTEISMNIGNMAWTQVPACILSKERTVEFIEMIRLILAGKKDSSHTLILGDDPGFAALQDKIKSYAELGMIFMIFTGVNHASLPDKFWIEFNEALTNPSVVAESPKEFSHRTIKRMYKGMRVIREEYRPTRYHRKHQSHEESPEQDPGQEVTCAPLQSIASSLLKSLSKPATVDLAARDAQASVDSTRACTPAEHAFVPLPTPAEHAFVPLPTPAVSRASSPVNNAFVPLPPTPAVSRASSPVNNFFAHVPTPAVSRASSPVGNPFAHLTMMTPTVSRASSPAWGHRVSPGFKAGRDRGLDEYMGILRSCSASPAVSPEKRARTASYSLRFTPAPSREGSPLLSLL